ncbi:DUF1748-domain-containing protein [Peniophora sp. CONT]|nr:DUF1748-domain-containing protein [Peniophora sp. CONT]
MAIGRLVHYAADAVLLSTILAGMKRSTGFAPDLEKVPDGARGFASTYLGVGETIYDFAQSYVVNSAYFKPTSTDLSIMSEALDTYREHIPDSLLDGLQSIRITTAQDFLFASPPLLFHRLPAGCTTLHELSETHALLLGLCSAQGIPGDALYEMETAEGSKLPCVTASVTELNDLVGGDFGGSGRGKVLEISGDAGSGKTALALHLVLHHLCTHEDASALWIDSVGEFSVERPTSLLRYFNGPAKPSVLDRLRVALAFEPDAVYPILAELHGALSSYTNSRPRILVIDTISALLGPHLSATSSEGHAMMAELMRTLRTLANMHGLCILVLNNSTKCLPYNPESNFKTTLRKPQLGPSFTFMTDATLWLDKFHPSAETAALEDGREGELRVAEVFRSRVSPSGTYCLFRMRGGHISAYENSSPTA